MAQSDLRPFGGQVPIAPHELAVNTGGGVPSITLTRFETGEPATYYLLPETVTALISSLIGTASPPAGEVWAVVKAEPKAIRLDGRDITVALTGIVLGPPEAATETVRAQGSAARKVRIDWGAASPVGIEYLRDAAIRRVIDAQLNIGHAVDDDQREAAHQALWDAAEALETVVDDPDEALAEYEGRQRDVRQEDRS